MHGGKGKDTYVALIHHREIQTTTMEIIEPQPTTMEIIEHQTPQLPQESITIRKDLQITNKIKAHEHVKSVKGQTILLYHAITGMTMP